MLNTFIRLTLAGLLLVAATCSRVEERLLNPPPNAPRATPRCLERAHADYYFAPGQIDDTKDDSSIRTAWFASYLRVAKADSLSCGEPSETLRLLLMPSFRHARIITLSFQKQHWTLDAVDFGDAPFGGRSASPPTTLKRSTRIIDEAEFERLRLHLTQLDFWGEPQYRNGGADDGWALAIEGRSGDKYRVVTKINVDDGYTAFGCTLFELARLSSFGEAVSFDCPQLPNQRSPKIPLP